MIFCLQSARLGEGAGDLTEDARKAQTTPEYMR